MKDISIINGRIVTPHRIIENGSLFISGGIITRVETEDARTGGHPARDITIIDAGGNYIAPGFIDLHVHGGGGSDFMDGTVDAFLKIAETHARFGTTALFPTTLTSEKEDLLHTLDIYRLALVKNERGAQLMGLHLEGPYFSMEQRGAQDPRYIRPPDEKEYRIDVEIIADGIHLPAPLLRLICKIKGPDRIALITDAMRAAGMPPGESILGPLKSGLRVIVEDGVAKLPDRSAFAGSVATADRLVRNMIKLAGLPLVDVIRMMTGVPARIMKIDREKGSLLPGKDADVVIFDEDIQIQTTIIKGQVVYERNG